MLNSKSPQTNCCVYGCSSNIRNVDELDFFKFPKNSKVLNGQKLIRVWIDAVKLPKRFSRQMKVCYRHFKEDDFIVKGSCRFLKSGVVPSKELPRFWRNKFHPRDYGRLVKQFEVRGIGRLRMCFEAKLARRLKKSLCLKNKSQTTTRNLKTQNLSDMGAEEATEKVTKNETTQPNFSQEPSNCPFSSEIDIKDEPISDLEGVEEDYGKGDTSTFSRSSEGDNTRERKEQQQNGENVEPNLSRNADSPVDRFSNQWNQNTASYNRGKTREMSCQICMIGFPTTEALTDHNQALHAKPLPRPYTCILCSETFRMKSALVEHVARHTIINSFQCRVCNQYFQTKYDLDDHFKGHRIMAKFYSCRECQTLLKTRAACWDHLNLHLRSRFNPAESLKCDACGRILSTQKALKEHLLVHEKEKPYECKLCNRKINQKTAFLLHVQGHTLGLPHQCTTCGMSFSKKSELTIHSTTEHRERKEFDCTICGLQFKSESKFIKHAITHDACLDYV